MNTGIREIIEQERENGSAIILHREGLFWRAYERSAYLFTMLVADYRPVRKFFKGIQISQIGIS